ncbi:uncharacterized protein LOC108602051 [Drosophila busckii]|uniref:uncharacterized protein LOC108602051 n=1 Tax=Drosophila busckii TaxID=30019 RepID=UPI00083F3FC9|nr:uncharacterized protein LOC108602051 [Drosophila busckii]
MRAIYKVMWLFIFTALIVQLSALSHSRRHMLRHKRLMSLYAEDSDGQESCKRTESDCKQKSPVTAKQGKFVVTNIAAKAAQEATKANDEMASAVRVASERIKLEYAEKASIAAKAALAAMAAKHQLLQQLEMEVREAEIVVQEESHELITAEYNSQLSCRALQQAKEELKLLNAGLKLARENFDSSEQVSTVCQHSMNDKAALVEAAQNRVEMLLRQLSDARHDYNKTKSQANRAMAAATEAKRRTSNRNTT